MIPLEQFETIAGGIIMVLSLTVGFRKLKKARNTKSKHQVFIEKAKKRGCVTTAQAVGGDWHNGDWDSNISELRNPSMTVKYRYVVNGREYFTHLTFQSPGLQRIQYPKTLDAYYDPKNPQNVDFDITENEMTRNEAGCLSAIGATIATLACLGVLYRLIVAFLF